MPYACDMAGTVWVVPTDACYTIFHHNEIRDLTAKLLGEICHGASTELPLQPISGEVFNPRLANRDNGARLDVVATNFWKNNGQKSFFDIRFLNPLAPSNINMSLTLLTR